MSMHESLLVVALVIFGLVQMLYGYRLFRILVGVIGALFGFLSALNGAWLSVSGIAFLLGQIASPPRRLPFEPEGSGS
jgi:hypothetical protein